jgi:CubicO group peptidase (beta-lactamase class C family)
MVNIAHRALRWCAAAVVMVAAATGCSGATRPESASSRDPARADTAVAGDEFMTDVERIFEASNTGGYDNVRAVVVTVDERPIVERYYRSSAETTSNVFSVTKSVMSMLIGIALDNGDLQGLDQTLAELLPSYADSMAPEAQSITLRQVLTMTSGLPSDLDIDPQLLASDDWVTTILAEGPSQPPGEVFSYSSDGSHLLSAILVEATGVSVLEYARRHLFDPLGIDTKPAAEPVMRDYQIDGYDEAGFAWPRDPEGLHTGWCCLKLTARDMVKFGQLWLNGGIWDGTQVVSADWVAASTRPHVATGEPPADHYGYQWWVTEADGHPAYAAVGYAGQLVEVVPALDLVVAVSSVEAPNNAAAASLMDIVSTIVAPALRT